MKNSRALCALTALGLMNVAACHPEAPSAPSVPEAARNGVEAPSPVTRDSCPSETALEALHAATFQFEHGLRAEGYAALERARRLLARPVDATSAAVLTRLDRVAAMLSAGKTTGIPSEALVELEAIRVTFRSWPCLPEAMHAQFHAALPPLDPSE